MVSVSFLWSSPRSVFWTEDRVGSGKEGGKGLGVGNYDRRSGGNVLFFFFSVNFFFRSLVLFLLMLDFYLFSIS